MCLVLVLEAICVAINTPASSIAAVVFVFLFEACFTWGWMATVWIYPPEILPLKTRAKGASLAAAADFLGNFLVVEITPPALRNIGYKTYIIFAVLNIANAVIVWAFYPETAGQTLESVDKLFVGEWEDEVVVGDRVPLVRKAQWKVVRRARAVRKAKKEVLGDDTGLDQGNSESGKGAVRHVEGRSGMSSSYS
jgi:hypothetical protein